MAPLGEILPGKAIQVPSLLAHSFRWYWPGNRGKLEDGMFSMILLMAEIRLTTWDGAETL